MPAVIFSGNKVRTLKSTLNLNGGADVISSTTDPTSVAVSAEPGSILLNTTSGKLYRKNDSGSTTNWTEVGSGTSGLNYISNPSADSATTGWSTYADAAGTQPVDGTGGSANVTWTRSTTTPLRGSADFNFAKDAANRQGQGVSTDFTIDLADQAKVLSVTFDYEVVSGTYADGDLTIYLIADPSGTPIVLQPAGYTIVSATTGTKMKALATFQTQATGQAYRLCFHVASTSASAYTLAIDSVVIGPQPFAITPAMSDWKSYTPTWTNFTTGTLNEGYWKRDGDTMLIVATGIGSAPTGTVTVSIPSGFAIDTAKVAGYSFNAATLGHCTAYSGSGTTAYTGTVYSIGTTNTVGMEGPSNSAWNATTPVTFGSGAQIQVNFRVPIVGWSSNVVSSADTDSRVVALNAYRNAGQTIANITLTKVQFDNVLFDNFGSFDKVTNYRYTIPVPGYYQIHGQVSFAQNSTGVRVAYLYVNGTEVAEAGDAAVGTSLAAARVSSIQLLKAGDYVELFVYQDCGGNLDLYANGGAKFNFLTLHRLAGPAVVQATETVAAKYYISSAPVLSANDYFNYDTKIFDTHNAVTTGTGATWKFTCPVGGIYEISVVCRNATAAYAAQLMKNDVFQSAFLYMDSTSTRLYAGSLLVQCVAGDKLAVRCDTGITVTLDGAQIVNIKRI